MKSSINNLFKKSIGLTGFVILIVVWSLFSRGVNPIVLPSPLEVGRALFDLGKSGELWGNFFITFKRTLIGFTIAFLAGMSIAFLIRKSSLLRQILNPLISFIQANPPVVWLVLAVIWFGIAQEITPIFIIFIIVFPIILINFLEGLDSFDEELIQMAKVFNCKETKIFFHILIPGISPCIISSARIGIAFAWKSTVLAEYLGSSSGVGFMLSMANSLLDTSRVFAWALVLILTILGLEYLIISPIRKKVNLRIECARS